MATADFDAYSSAGCVVEIDAAPEGWPVAHQHGELRAQNDRFSAAVENMSHGLCMFDAEERMIICNGHYIDIFRLSPAVMKPGIAFIDILRHSVEVGIASHTAEELYAIRKPFIARAQPSNYEEILADGRIINISHRPLGVGGWVSIYEDITEQRRAETDLREQHRRFDAALANMSQGLLMYDADKRLIVRNERFLELYGISATDVSLGMTHRQVFDRLVELGLYRDIDGDIDIPAAEARLQTGLMVALQRQLTDGRTFEINHRPMSGGGWVATFDDVTERRRVEERMIHLAHHDPLTNLPNRSVFREKLDHAIAAAQPAGGSFAILSLDLDRFKAINDTWGHPAGDWLLKSVAERLLRCLRGETDVVARFGGDEFAILQLGLNTPADAERLARRIVDAVSKPYKNDSCEMRVGISIGIALSSLDGEDVDTLLKNADMALYRAKHEGRNIYRFFEPGMDARVRERRALEADLRRALARREFALHFQPILDIAAGEIVCFEALLRWNSPERDQVPPDVFISVAEETKLIVPLGEWALRKACMTAAGWPAHLRVAVNVSAVQIRSGTFPRTVVSALAHSRLPANRLELEITETVLMDESDVVVTTLRQLRDLGVRIALDDFGTGYSSLGYLRRFPVDKIKIDRSFVSDIDQRDTAAIVRAILGLGAQLGITVTAEGVETETQLDILRKEGCVEAQGHLVGLPMNNADLRQALKQISQSRRFG